MNEFKPAFMEFVYYKSQTSVSLYVYIYIYSGFEIHLRFIIAARVG